MSETKQPDTLDEAQDILQEFLHNVEMNRLEYGKTGNDNYERCLLNAQAAIQALQDRAILEGRLVELDLLEQALNDGRDIQTFKLQRRDDLIQRLNWYNNRVMPPSGENEPCT